MSAADVLRKISERGLTLSLNGADLRLGGPQSRIDQALVAEIRSAKSEIVAYLRSEAGTGAGAERPGFPATPMQQSYFYGRQHHFALGNISSHAYHEIEGVFDRDRLERALSKVITRHGTLRTVFAEDARQIELPAANFPAIAIAVRDLRGRSAEEQKSARLAVRAAMSHQVLPADRAPLLDVRLTLLADDLMVLHVSHDGLVMDAVSVFLFFRDWARFYDEPGLPATPLGASFRSHVAALDAGRSTPAYARARDYWTLRLDDIQPRPQLPMRADPASLKEPVSTRRTITLDPPRWQKLKAHGEAAGLTPTALLAAAYAEVLSLWGAGERFTLNVTFANRLPIHPEIDRLIGNFTDTLLLAVEIIPSDDFRQRALALQGRLREALDHRHFSGIEVMRALGRRAGASEAAPMPFTFNSTIGAAREGVDASAIAAFGRETYAVSQTPQVWVNVSVAESQGALVIDVDSLDELFPEDLVGDLVSAYERLLALLAADEAAWLKRDHTLLPDRQIERRRQANRTAAPIADGQIYSAFLERAERAPDALAIRTSTAQISYGDLRAAALAAAAWLRSQGVERNEIVAIVMRKRWEQLVGILGAAIAGAAYLPVDADLPSARIEYMLSNARVRHAFVEGPLGAGLPAQVTPLAIDEAFIAASLRKGETPPLGAVVPAGVEQSDLAYVLYTSGSTGTPKGVMINHRSVVNLVADIAARFGIGAEDRFFAISSCSFDLSVFDIFGALSTGAALVVPDWDKAADPAHWLDLAAAGDVSVWNSVPAIVEMLVGHAAAAGLPLPPLLRLVMMSGDRIPVPLPARIGALKPDARIVSLGGPTETTVWNVVYPIDRIDPAWSSIPYGRPTANNRAYVLDRQGRQCPDHVSGEICAAGAGLAIGYLGDAAMTAERFFDHESLGEKLYRTGDLGRYLSDGNIEILGRADFQLKLNGYRIEAGEIETALDGHAAVERSAVVRSAGGGEPRLVAFLVPGDRNQPTAEIEEALRQSLAARLPSYMIPHRFVWIDRLPLTRNGKVDRQRLEEPEAAPASATDATPAAAPGPETALEHRLAEIWSDVLEADAIGPLSRFYCLGGTSLTAVRLLARIRKEFKVSIPLNDLPRLETPRAMAARLEQATS